MTVRELILALMDTGRLDDEVVVPCEITHSNRHRVIGVEDQSPHVLLYVQDGVDVPNTVGD